MEMRLWLEFRSKTQLLLVVKTQFSSVAGDAVFWTRILKSRMQSTLKISLDLNAKLALTVGEV